MSGNETLYPLLLEPIYKQKVWGGRALERLGRTLPGDEQMLIGESWELADLGSTSTSGGGGGAERSRIVNGPLAEQTFGQLIDSYGQAMLGDLPLNAAHEFPLLLKFLDARQNLSVQVHPSAAYANRHEAAHLKSEAWYILDCEPDAVIYKGIKEGVGPEQLRQALQSNTDEAVLPLLRSVPVQPGECHYLPSGTCHALGAGIVVAEVQTPSDTTFRVYDWGRTGRELHIEQAIECITFGPPEVSGEEKNIRVTGLFGDRTQLVETEYFRIDRTEVTERTEELLERTQPEVWMTLAGEGRLTWPDVSEDRELHFHPGQTIYLPPALKGCRLEVEAGAAWLEVGFPQAGSTTIA